MTATGLALAGCAVLGASGVPGLAFRRGNRRGQQMSVLLACLGSVIGLVAVAMVLGGDDGAPIRLPWSIPAGEFHVALDPLSAIFLAPVFLIAALGSVYGLDYWAEQAHPDSGRRVRFFYGLLALSMGLIILSRNAVLFLFGWEVMAICAFFLVATEHHKKDVRDAAWVYLVATHVSSLLLWIAFAVMRKATGSWTLQPLDGAAAPAVATFFVIGIGGCTIKAGLMPMHVWLPGAHANAPTHVSALMSGVLIKVGVYGLVRFASVVVHPPASFGALLLTLGTVSALLGVAYALGQHDIKRLLAYHSIENIGIIAMGLGLALLGRTYGRAELVALGLGGCLLHVWNHALFKALLFFGAGAVVHATGTREIDRMGGLARTMPFTALMFLVGAVAICGLPPLNGFVSELLVYLGLTRTALGGPPGPAAALAVPALAIVGALAVACFVKVYGAVFLGEARGKHVGHEAPRAMRLPMGVLAACCVLIGLAPFLVLPALDRAAAVFAPELDPISLASVAPLTTMSLIGLALVAVVVAGVLWLRRRATNAPTTGTWDCGYATPTARMQYTASSFAENLVDLLRAVLRPRAHAPEVHGLFPKTATFSSHVDDVVLERAVRPSFSLAAHALHRIRVLQGGRLHIYVLYILIAAAVLLGAIFPLDRFLEGLWRP